MTNTCTVTMFGTRFINVEQPIEKPIEQEVKKPVVENPEQINNLAPNQEYSKDKFKKDGTPKIITHNKRKGVKSEAYDLSLADMNKLLTWLEQNEKWLVRFLAIVSFNLARRKGDILSLTWAHFYDPKTGDFRKRLKDISEEKTDKLASPYINDVVKNAIKEYCEKVGCNPADNGFTRPIAYQYTSNYRGRVLSDSSFYKTVKKAAQECNIEYNVALHSLRKGFGAVSYETHKNEGNALETLQSIFNHNSTRITERYISREDKRIRKYYEDLSDIFTRCALNGETAEFEGEQIEISPEKIKRLIATAYQAGMKNANETDMSVHVESINEINGMIND